jgi:hypothetical protein
MILQELVAHQEIVPLTGIQKWWKMSPKAAEYFAGKFVTCVQDYPLILADTN